MKKQSGAGIFVHALILFGSDTKNNSRNYAEFSGYCCSSILMELAGTKLHPLYLKINF
jgi:hypothetical protein